jgi:transcriptional regulator with XRE-family HTH domain
MSPDESEDRLSQLIAEVVPSAFGQRLRYLILRKGWNQSELARQAGIGRDSISSYIAGRARPNNLNAHKLAEALGVNLGELLPPAKSDALPLASAATTPRLSLEGAATGDITIQLARTWPSDIALRFAKLVLEADEEAAARLPENAQ